LFLFPPSILKSSSSWGGGQEWFSAFGFFGWKGACVKIGFGGSKGSGSLAKGGAWRDGLFEAIGVLVGDVGGGAVLGWIGVFVGGWTDFGWIGAFWAGWAGAGDFGCGAAAFGGAGAAALGCAGAGLDWKRKLNF